MTHLTIGDIFEARKRIREDVVETPLIRARKLEELFGGGQVWLKLESFQPTGSFKVRGVANKMRSLTPEERGRGVCAASSGNHAQAVSYMAEKLGTSATIVMPENAPKSKVVGAQGYGAEVVLYGYTGEDREEECDRLMKSRNLSLVHSHTDPYVIAGHGTVALEVYEQMKGDLDELVIPCGAGSLTSGAAFAMKQIAPEILTTGVEPEEVPRFTESLKAGKPVTVVMGNTMADGLRVSKAEDINYDLIAENLGRLWTVGEESIARAVKEMTLRGKAVVEPSGCVGIAAALEGKIDVGPGRKVCFILTGGNIDGDLLKELLK